MDLQIFYANVFFAAFLGCLMGFAVSSYINYRNNQEADPKDIQTELDRIRALKEKYKKH